MVPIGVPAVHPELLNDLQDIVKPLKDFLDVRDKRPRKQGSDIRLIYRDRMGENPVSNFIIIAVPFLPVRTEHAS